MEGPYILTFVEHAALANYGVNDSWFLDQILWGLMNALVNEVAALAYREQMSAFHSVEEQYFSLTLDDLPTFHRTWFH